MPQEVASLFAEIGLDSRKFEKGLKETDQGLRRLEDVLGEAIAGVDKFGDEAKRGFDDAAGAADNLGGDVSKMFTAFLSADLAADAIGFITGALMDAAGAVLEFGKEYSNAMSLMAARTGESEEAVADLGEQARDVWKQGFGENISDAIDAITQVNNVLGETGDTAEDSARRALIMRDVFQIDINESLRAANSAVNSFGIDSETAFNLMAKVIQEVGDPAGDLADTFNEYSTLLAKAGFSAEEFTNILIAGMEAGARNTDQVADALKEFTIRIVDGSDTTRNALDQLFDATDTGDQRFFDLQRSIEDTSGALEKNEEALKNAEGAYKAQEKVVSDLESALDRAQRRLDELSRPNLAGMEEFDDQIFELEQQAKKTELALLDMTPDTAQFDATEARLDGINKQIDKLALQRDIQFEPQLRAIDKFAKEGTEDVKTYAEAWRDVGNQKFVIEEIEKAIGAANKELGLAADPVIALREEQASLMADMAMFEGQLAGLKSPTEDFLEALASGQMTARDAFFQLIPLLAQVDDDILRNQIGVALLGTKYEDLGENVIQAMGAASGGVEEFTGLVDEAGEQVTSGPWAELEQLMRNALDALLPVIEKLIAEALPSIQAFVDGAIPLFERFSSAIAPSLEMFFEALGHVEEALGLTEGSLDPVNLALGLLEGLLTTVVGNVIWAAGQLEALATWINSVGEALDWVNQKWDAFGSAMEGMGEGLPDWLVPGSPTPLELGLRGVGDAIKAMPALDFGMGTTATAPAGGGGSSTTHSMNINGMSFGPFGSADEADQKLLAILRMLRQQVAATAG